MSEVLDLSGFGAEVNSLMGRVEHLQQRALHQPDEPRVLVDEVVAELQTTVEELRVSYEELSAQNDALIDSRRRLEEEHARYRAVFDAAPVPYLITDLRGVVRAANKAAVAMLGVDVRFLPGKPLVSFVAIGHRGDVRRVVTAVSSTGRSASREWDVQPRRRPPVPATFDVGVLQRDGISDGLLWLVRNLSREKSLEQDALSLRERLVARETTEEKLLAAADLAAADVAGRLLDEDTLPSLLEAVARAANGLLPDAAGASVNIFEQGRPREVGVSAAWLQDLEDSQFGLHEGPSVAVMADGNWHAEDDLPAGRWKRFGNFAAGHGIMSALAVPLRARGATLGVLTFYSTRRAAFAQPAAEVAQRFAAPTSAALANAVLVAASRRLSEELEQALVSRSTIDMAKGILMSKLSIGPDAAFEALRGLSQQRHLKLRDLAGQLVNEYTR